MFTLKLAFNSLISRRVTVLLTLLAVSLSVMLLLGVEKIRTETRKSFSNTISGTDLIVGARSGSLPLLLYSVFRIGMPRIIFPGRVTARSQTTPMWLGRFLFRLGIPIADFAFSARMAIISSTFAMPAPASSNFQKADLLRIFSMR